MLGSESGERSRAKIGASRVLSLGAATAPLIQEAVAYWRSKTPAGAPFPARSHIDPLDVPRLLPNLALAEVHRLPELRFRFRVFGSDLAETFQLEASGKWVTTEAIGPIAPNIHADFARIVETQVPRAIQSSAQQPGRDHVSYQVVDLPLGTPEEGVTMILSCLERLS